MSAAISSNAVSVISTGLALRATAADIPIELYALLLSFLITEYSAIRFTTSQDERNHVKLNKRELGAISLVCREWALACRPKIFEEIWLFNKEDMDVLSTFLGNSLSCIYLYIRIVWCRHSVATPSPPWIHKVFMTLPQKLHFSPVFRVEATSGIPSQSSKQRPSTVQSILPRHLPSAVLRMQSLMLMNMHFRRFSDLLSPFKEIPSLERCACTKVTWDRSLDELPRTILSPSHRQSHINYRMEDCTDNSAAVWMATALSTGKQNRILQRDADALGNAGRALTRYIDAKAHPNWFMSSIREQDALRASLIYLFHRICVTDIWDEDSKAIILPRIIAFTVGNSEIEEFR